MTKPAQAPTPTPSATAAPKPKRVRKHKSSGTQWSDEDYKAAGWERLSLRVKADLKERMVRMQQRLGKKTMWEMLEEAMTALEAQQDSSGKAK